MSFGLISSIVLISGIEDDAKTNSFLVVVQGVVSVSRNKHATGLMLLPLLELASLQASPGVNGQIESLILEIENGRDGLPNAEVSKTEAIERLQSCISVPVN